MQRNSNNLSSGTLQSITYFYRILFMGRTHKLMLRKITRVLCDITFKRTSWKPTTNETLRWWLHPSLHPLRKPTHGKQNIRGLSRVLSGDLRTHAKLTDNQNYATQHRYKRTEIRTQLRISFSTCHTYLQCNLRSVAQHEYRRRHAITDKLNQV
jgi:hypothetical protein